MVDDFQPSRQKTDLAEVVEMLLDKGIVINADIAVSIGDTQLLGVQLRAAIASFETAARYGLEFPEGTDMRRVAEAVGEPELAEMDRPNPAIDPTRSVNVSSAEDEEPVDAPGNEAGGTGETASADDGDGEKQDEQEGPIRIPERSADRVGRRPSPRKPVSGSVNPIGDDGDQAGDVGADGDEDGIEEDVRNALEDDEEVNG
ncbi:gas vesicle protein GvpJ [Natrarchaeobaculum aegyptiacum]|uniref:gas vesicle protein GvpJ n=1 Tax=Natrarchaeobaculum aegyptiacum TaxID=745377 RepID=UPI001E63B33D